MKYFTQQICSAAKIPSTDDPKKLSRRLKFAEYSIDWRLRRALELARQDLENQFA